MKANVEVVLNDAPVAISGDTSFNVRMTERERKFIPRLVESLKDKELPWGTKCATPEYAVRYLIEQLMLQWEKPNPEKPVEEKVTKPAAIAQEVK